MICEICSSLVSEPIAELFSLPTVTSDCRAWTSGCSVTICSGCGVMKRVTNKQFNCEVYKEYTSYPEPTGRTETVLKFVFPKFPRPRSVLDIGCGRDSQVLKLFEQFPDVVRVGYEPTIHEERPKGKFDLITLFHVFEHVEDLHEILSYIKSSLTENGHVLIQVPAVSMWPFDLIIADHEWHFNCVSLMELLDKNGFQCVNLGTSGIGFPINKELTLLAKIGNPQPCMPCEHWDSINKPIDWLLNFKNKLDFINKPVAVYGTSVSAMWAANILGDKVVCYIDDDNSRLGEFNGKPVIEPKGNRLPVVAPFPDWQLAEIKAKNSNLMFL